MVAQIFWLSFDNFLSFVLFMVFLHLLFHFLPGYIHLCAVIICVLLSCQLSVFTDFISEGIDISGNHYFLLYLFTFCSTVLWLIIFLISSIARCFPQYSGYLLHSCSSELHILCNLYRLYHHSVISYWIDEAFLPVVVKSLSLMCKSSVTWTS